MQLFTADYVLLAVTLGSTVIGAFIGFSGALAFLGGTVVGVLGGKVAWMLSAGRIDSGWPRVLVTLVAGLVIFGLVRWCVRRIVNGLLRQPADAVFGMIVAALTGLAIALVAVFGANYSGWVEIRSSIMTKVVELGGIGG